MRQLFTLLSVLGLTTALVACQPSTTGTGSQGSSSSSAMQLDNDGNLGGEDEDETQDAMDDDGMETSSAATSDSGRVVTIVASNFAFTPNIIMVKKGEKVTLAVQGTGATHGIAIPGLGINLKIMTGATESVTIPTDKTGTFDFFCSVPCGPGHKQMTGKVVIE